MSVSGKLRTWDSVAMVINEKWNMNENNFHHKTLKFIVYTGVCVWWIIMNGKSDITTIFNFIKTEGFQNSESSY